MTQQDLFGVRGLTPAQQEIAQQKREQTRQLARVAGSLKHVILAWYEQHLPGSPVFHLTDLVAAVQRVRKTTPASVDRILRQLRQEGELNYRVLDRGASLYELLPGGR